MIIAWASNIKEVHGKPRLSLVSYCLEYGRHVARLRRRRRRRRRAYAPTSNTACHDNITAPQIKPTVSKSVLKVKAIFVFLNDLLALGLI